MEKIIAVSTSFNPDIQLLEKVIISLREQVSEMIIVDDCSREEIRQNIKSLAEKFPNFVTLIFNSENSGIGISLNKGARLAIEKGADWILTTDDDTIFEKDTIKTMIDAYNAQNEKDKEKIGLITPNIKDIRSLIWPIDSPITINENGGITGGQMVKTKIIPIVGFWNEGLFIEDVDAEFCFRVDDAEFKTLNVPNAVINVRWGNPKLGKLFKRIIIIPNYPPYRYYYTSRNHFYLYIRNFKKYVNWKRKNSFIYGIIIPRYLIKALLYEDQKCKKIWMATRGTFDGLRGKMGKLK